MKTSWSFFKARKLKQRVAAFLVMTIALFGGAPSSPAAIFFGGSYDGSSSTTASFITTPAYISFTTSPSSVPAGQVFGVQPIVTIYDANNNVHTSSGCTISLSINNNPSGGTLGGTTSMSSSSGVANFSAQGLFIDKPGEMYTLLATAQSCSSAPTSTTATSNSFSVLPADYIVKSELLYDASAEAYFINSWLERGGSIVSDSGWGTSKISIAIVDAVGTSVTAPTYVGMLSSNSIFKHSWTPPDETETYIAAITITYPSATSKTYSGIVAYQASVSSTGGGGDGSFTDEDRTNLEAIKASTDTLNWTDIDAIKTAVGVGEAQTVYEKVGSILTSVNKANWDDLKVLSESGINWANIRTQSTAQINWDDLRVMSSSGIRWAEIAGFSVAGINWDDLTELTTNGVNWADIGRLSTEGINWTDLNVLTTVGINWSDIQAMSDIGINWADIKQLSEAGVNWLRIGNMTAYSINWADIDRLSKAGVNWEDIQQLSAAGIQWDAIEVLSSANINWEDINAMSRAGANWDDFAKMTGANVNWSENIDWDNLALLSNAGVNWTDIQVMSDANVNWDGIDELSRSGINWGDIGSLSQAQINWDDLQVMSLAGVNWGGMTALTEAGVNWDDIGVLSAAGVNWSGITALSEGGVNWEDIQVMSEA
ncbi:MAG TPA: hypothetical protein PLY88_06105, partial [Candidatus Omnitrophota bacterium]|nr:hypothetical protein [Candidatus Omnitrophota bacterium]